MYTQVTVGRQQTNDTTGGILQIVQSAQYSSLFVPVHNEYKIPLNLLRCLSHFVGTENNLSKAHESYECNSKVSGPGPNAVQVLTPLLTWV